MLSLLRIDQDIILLTVIAGKKGRYRRGVEVMRETGSREVTEKSEDGDEGRIRSTLYTILILRSHDYLLVFIWLPTFPYSSFLGLSGAAQLCRSVLDHSTARVEG